MKDSTTILRGNSWRGKDGILQVSLSRVVSALVRVRWREAIVIELVFWAFVISLLTPVALDFTWKATTGIVELLVRIHSWDNERAKPCQPLHTFRYDRSSGSISSVGNAPLSGSG
jgi:hypothetical protein